MDSKSKLQFQSIFLITRVRKGNTLFFQSLIFQKWFESLSYSIKKWFSDGIDSIKSPAARIRRADQVAEQLLSAMEAEQELPPALKLTFSQEPRALEGWKLMSPLQRRHNLLAVFYYRSPEARERRLGKVVQLAVSVAERKK